MTAPEFQDDGQLIRAALEALAGEDVEVIATSRAPSGVAAMPSPTDLTAAAVVVDLSRAVVDAGAWHLATTGEVDVDVDQVVAYDLAHAAAGVETARATLEYVRHVGHTTAADDEQKRHAAQPSGCGA